MEYRKRKREQQQQHQRCWLIDAVAIYQRINATCSSSSSSSSPDTQEGWREEAFILSNTQPETIRRSHIRWYSQYCCEKVSKHIFPANCTHKIIQRITALVNKLLVLCARSGLSLRKEVNKAEI